MKGEALFTDLYELTMLHAYFNEGMEQPAVFDLFVRRLPSGRNFLVAGGLEQVLEFLENLHFSAESLQYLDSLRTFSAGFLESLQRIRFTGNVRAVPEGTIVFPQEPLIEVEAPLPQAQLIETYLLNQVTFQTVIASAAARTVISARGRTLVDFGSRRAHGTDAGLKAARALYLAGYASTSNVLAGRKFGIPVAGTMAHSYIQAHESEPEAFREFVQSFPETTLLVDTYDTLQGVRRAAEVARAQKGKRISAIRLDSGDLDALSRGARQILDEAGLQEVRIFASGGLNTDEIARLVAGNAPIDAFGVGTSAVVSPDAPVVDSVYKLVSYAGEPRLKLSTDKATLPGRKQVWRRQSRGRMAGDVLSLLHEQADGQPLLVEVMTEGYRTTAGLETLAAIRDRVRSQLELLPPEMRSLEGSDKPYKVSLSAGLQTEWSRLAAEFGRDSAFSG